MPPKSTSVRLQLQQIDPRGLYTAGELASALRADVDTITKLSSAGKLRNRSVTRTPLYLGGDALRLIGIDAQTAPTATRNVGRAASKSAVCSEPKKKWLLTREVASLLETSVRNVQRWTHGVTGADGTVIRLTAFRFGKHFKYRRRDVVAFWKAYLKTSEVSTNVPPAPETQVQFRRRAKRAKDAGMRACGLID